MKGEPDFECGDDIDDDNEFDNGEFDDDDVVVVMISFFDRVLSLFVSLSMCVCLVYTHFNKFVQW
jgi:hypothetical protein